MAERESLHSLRLRMTPGDRQAEENLILAAENLIRSAVRATLVGTSSIGNLEEAVQEGRLAAVHAIRGWRKERGVSFSTYLFKSVRHAVYKWLLAQPMIRVPASGIEAGYVVPQVLSLDAAVPGRHSTVDAVWEYRETCFLDSTADPDDRIAALLTRLRIEEILRGGLSERSYQVFQRLMEGYTAPEVGRMYGLTPAQVYVIRATARKLIRSNDERDD